jgi:hypothetical protein
LYDLSKPIPRVSLRMTRNFKIIVECYERYVPVEETNVPLRIPFVFDNQLLFHLLLLTLISLIYLCL